MSHFAGLGLPFFQVYFVRSPSFFKPPAKILSPEEKRSREWYVVVGTKGSPPPLSTPPEAIVFGSQSPIPPVGTLAFKLPSIPNPVVGGVTGAVPGETAD
jgi:hypothetical protein